MINDVNCNCGYMGGTASSILIVCVFLLVVASVVGFSFFIFLPMFAESMGISATYFYVTGGVLLIVIILAIIWIIIKEVI